MTDKEKAAELEVMSVNQCTKDEVSEFATDINLFLAGCTYQEQVDREVIEKQIENLKEAWKSGDDALFFDTIVELKQFHKATGQAEKE